MRSINKLLDKARRVCSLDSDAQLAERLHVSAQLVSQWRKGKNPISDERVTQLAQMAHEEPGAWLVLVNAEQSAGATAKAWLTVSRRLGAAASLAAIALLYHPASQAAPIGVSESVPAIGIMRSTR